MSCLLTCFIKNHALIWTWSSNRLKCGLQESKVFSLLSLTCSWSPPPCPASPWAPSPGGLSPQGYYPAVSWGCWYTARTKAPGSASRSWCPAPAAGSTWCPGPCSAAPGIGPAGKQDGYLWVDKSPGWSGGPGGARLLQSLYRGWQFCSPDFLASHHTGLMAEFPQWAVRCSLPLYSRDVCQWLFTFLFFLLISTITNVI